MGELQARRMWITRPGQQSQMLVSSPEKGGMIVTSWSYESYENVGYTLCAPSTEWLLTTHITPCWSSDVLRGPRDLERRPWSGF